MIESNPVEFEWDEGNTDKNEVKHSVTNEEAEEVFMYEYRLKADTVHSLTEQRYHAIGCTSAGRVLHITFVVRSERIRVISARDAHRKEISLLF